MTESATPDEIDTARLVLAHEEGDVRVLRISGALDIDTASHVLELAMRELGGGAEHICLDLDGVSFIDSTGLAAIIDLQRRANMEGSFFALACGDGPVRRLVELAFLERQLPVHPDVPHALSALRR